MILNTKWINKMTQRIHLTMDNLTNERLVKLSEHYNLDKAKTIYRLINDVFQLMKDKQVFSDTRQYENKF
jgi:hypothetical protein